MPNETSQKEKAIITGMVSSFKKMSPEGQAMLIKKMFDEYMKNPNMVADTLESGIIKMLKT